MLRFDCFHWIHSLPQKQMEYWGQALLPMALWFNGRRSNQDSGRCKYKYAKKNCRLTTMSVLSFTAAATRISVTFTNDPTSAIHALFYQDVDTSIPSLHEWHSRIAGLQPFQWYRPICLSWSRRYSVLTTSTASSVKACHRKFTVWITKGLLQVCYGD